MQTHILDSLCFGRSNLNGFFYIFWHFLAEFWHGVVGMTQKQACGNGSGTSSDWLSALPSEIAAKIRAANLRDPVSVSQEHSKPFAGINHCDDKLWAAFLDSKTFSENLFSSNIA